MQSNNSCYPTSSISLGLDVDKKGSFVHAFDTETGEILFEGRLAHQEKTWRKFIKRFDNREMIAFYEAGVTGFVLYRMLIKLGIDCRVVAPSAIPKSSVDKQCKNDRRDAQTLAQLVNTPDRYNVRVPTEQEEQDRQLIRTREQLVKDRNRVKNQIKSLLLNYGITPPAAVKQAWSKNYLNWLRKNEDFVPALRIVLNAHLAHLDCLNQQIAELDKAIRDLSKSDDYRDQCQRLCQIPGVGILTSMAFLVETFRPEEFRKATHLASHLGLTPSEHSSGGHTRRGHLTHWGPGYLGSAEKQYFDRFDIVIG